MNQPALDLIDAVEGDVEGQPFPATPRWTGDADGSRRIREAIDTAAAGESTRLEIEVCGAAEEHVVDLSFQPISDGDDTGIDSIIAVGYDITERKRRERALRESREALERLHRITADPDRSFEDQIDDLLAFGCSYLGTSVAFLSRIDEATDHFEIVRSHGDHPLVQPGAETDLGSTYCRHTIAGDSDGTMTVTDAAEEMADDPAYDAIGLGCYAGGEVHIDGELYGTLCFVDPDAREVPFSPTSSSRRRSTCSATTRTSSASTTPTRGRFPRSPSPTPAPNDSPIRRDTTTTRGSPARCSSRANPSSSTI